MAWDIIFEQSFKYSSFRICKTNHTVYIFIVWMTNIDKRSWFVEKSVKVYHKETYIVKQRYISVNYTLMVSTPNSSYTVKVPNLEHPKNSSWPVFHSIEKNFCMLE